MIRINEWTILSPDVEAEDAPRFATEPEAAEYIARNGIAGIPVGLVEIHEVTD